jgi:nitrous oxidase accessory protein
MKTQLFLTWILVSLIVMISTSSVTASRGNIHYPIPNTQYPIPNTPDSITHSPTHPLLLVSPTGPYTSIPAALADAHDGDVIEVRGGTYPALVVDKSVTLIGVGWPVIDGGGQDTVVTLSAPGIVFRGFEVRGSGNEPDTDDAGILAEAPNILIENNRLRDVLFGVFISAADNTIVRGNNITSKAEYDLGRKGDGIRLWYSQNVLMENNHVHEARDIVMWYSADAVLRGNLIENGRYGVHFMYCDGAIIERNQVRGNTVGLFVMYSDNIIIRENEIRDHHGLSGYALGFKDADNIEVTGNLLIDNQAGAYLDGLPYSPQGFGRFQDNIFAFNNVGVILMPAVRGNVFENNTFWENVQQMAIQGGGGNTNTWQGNYWSDYPGFDAGAADGAGTPDGVGDIPYRAERLFENMLDREPMLRALIYSPAVQAIETAASAFPLMRPQPKLEDPFPRMIPAEIPAFVQFPSQNPVPMWITSLAFTGLALLFGALAFVKPGKSPSLISNLQNAGVSMKLPSSSPPLLSVHHVTKRYKKVTALEEVSFELAPGTALALWGVNGAGKTTLLKAVLGLIDFGGHIEVGGYDVRRQGKLVRRLIGYVPQEFAFYDLGVLETLHFYARLKKADPARIPNLLERLGLNTHTEKRVSALSGGLRQRLALAAALLDDPPLLMLDEPLANLDARARRDYQALLASLRKEGKTLLFASHRLEEVETLADQVLVLQEGRLLEIITPEELRTRHLTEIDLVLWVPEPRRMEALTCLEAEGYPTHLNGRGTVVVRVPETRKAHPLATLHGCEIPVLNFELSD